MSPTRTIVAKISSYEHGTSCLKNSAKLKGTDIFLNEGVSPATQSIRNAKMGELQAARQRGLIAYFSGTKLVTIMRRSTHPSHENAATLESAEGTAARDDTSGHGNTVQVEADRTGSSEEEGVARVVQDRAGSQASLIPLRAKQVSAAAPVKKKIITRSNSSREKFIN